jgi:hypothetical protein
MPRRLDHLLVSLSGQVCNRKCAIGKAVDWIEWTEAKSTPCQVACKFRLAHSRIDERSATQGQSWLTDKARATNPERSLAIEVRPPRWSLLIDRRRRTAFNANVRRTSLPDKHVQRIEQRLQIVLALIYWRRRGPTLEQVIDHFPRRSNGAFDGEGYFLRNLDVLPDQSEIRRPQYDLKSVFNALNVFVRQ